MFNKKFNPTPYQGNWEIMKFELISGWLDLDPPYQRGYVWSQRFQRELIISIFSGFPIGSIIRRTQDKNRKIEIIDGQQRIKTIWRFVDGKLSLNSTHSQQAKEILNSRKGDYDKYKGNIHKFSDLTKKDQHQFTTSFIFSGFEIKSDDDDGIKKYFDKIQTQEKLLAGELISNLPNNIFDDVFEKNESYIEKFCNFFKFNNSRKNFQKAIFNSIGFNLEYIELAILDDKLIKFVNDLSNKTRRVALSYDEIKFKNELEKYLFQIQKLNFEIKIKKAKQRFLKLIFLIFNYIDKNDTINFEKIVLINEELSSYNTKWARKNEQAFIEKLIDKKIIEDKNEYIYFEDLYEIFYKTQKNTKEKKHLLKFWANKIK